jgi:hypothetical protein
VKKNPQIAELLRRAADAFESGFGERFELLAVDDHHDEEQVGRVVVLRPSGAKRIRVSIEFVGSKETAGLAKDATRE